MNQQKHSSIIFYNPEKIILEDLEYLSSQKVDLRPSVDLSEGLYWDLDERRLKYIFYQDKQKSIVSFNFWDYWKKWGGVERKESRPNKSLRKKLGPLAQALGANFAKNDCPKVIETHGGSGKDSLFLLQWNIDLRTYEKSFTVYLMLQDARRWILENLYKDHLKLNSFELASIEILKDKLTNHWEILLGSATESGDQAYLMYMDPFYEKELSRSSSALPTKEMNCLKNIGFHEDWVYLFDYAVKMRFRKIIVKRPSSFNLDQRKNFDYKDYDHQDFSGKLIRFEVFSLKA